MGISPYWGIPTVAHVLPPPLPKLLVRRATVFWRICFSWGNFYTTFSNTSAVSSVFQGSILIFASCVMLLRPRVYTDVVLFEDI